MSDHRQIRARRWEWLVTLALTCCAAASSGWLLPRPEYGSAALAGWLALMLAGIAVLGAWPITRSE